MIVITETVEIEVGGSRMRTLVVAPKTASSAPVPGIVLYSDIFQLTGPHVRSCVRLAGHGFVVAAPEIYHWIEPAGAAIPFDDAGRTRGLDDAARTPVAHFDADCRAALDWLAADPRVAKGKLGVAGFCIGGHLAFRGALQRDVRATVCFYPTGLDAGKLGKDADAGSLARAREIRGQLLLVFGENDPHVPLAARTRIESVLHDARTNFQTLLFPAEHAFMRDEGPRFDPAATDQAWAQAIAFLKRSFS
ncbi:MAG: dienelactone hydrolase family protein [Planctomycetes bacterium]|nr:dienelactone hydrolase family protein [Planctomycetota bacterium]MBI3847300.1 dienelactone hydrolase family protein [Planctomycetota bacterium]